MTGTAKTEEKEFQEIYGMDVVPIPTNKPIQRIDLPDQAFRTIDHKYKAVAEKVKELNQKNNLFSLEPLRSFSPKKLRSIYEKKVYPLKSSMRKRLNKKLN